MVLWRQSLPGNAEVSGAPYPGNVTDTAPTVASRFGILRPLRIRDFRLLWTGQTVSMIGDGIYFIALAWQVYELTNDDPGALALVGIAWTIPVVLLSLFAGVLADRFDRRRLLVVGDLLRLVAIGSIGVLSILDLLTMPWVVGLAALFGVGQAIFNPSLTSIVPTIVPEDLLVEANSLAQFVTARDVHADRSPDRRSDHRGVRHRVGVHRRLARPSPSRRSR